MCTDLETRLLNSHFRQTWYPLIETSKDLTIRIVERAYFVKNILLLHTSGMFFEISILDKKVFIKKHFLPKHKSYILGHDRVPMFFI